VRRVRYSKFSHGWNTDETRMPKRGKTKTRHVRPDCYPCSIRVPSVAKFLELKFLIPRSSFIILKWVLAAAILASLLFAHGCHGNEDHELFDAALHAIVK
jgi:hypothetical protein